MKDLSVSKPNRLKDYDYSRNGAYFITICVKDRRELLGRIVGGGFHAAPITELSDIGTEILNTIEYTNMNCRDVLIDKYVIMPNHIHLIVFLTGGYGNPPLPDVIGRLKSFTTKKWNELNGTKFQHIWQRSYHDHIIRDEKDYKSHWQYIDENPSKWAQDFYYTKGS